MQTDASSSAFKGGFWDWEKVLFAWVSAPWALSLEGEACGPT